MPDPITGLVIGGTSLLGGEIKSKSASKAANAQVQASEAGIEETRRQFDAMRELLKPYVERGIAAIPGLDPYLEAGEGAIPGLERFGMAGDEALGGQMDILGLNGDLAQRRSIEGIEDSPLFDILARQGEDAILQSGSATGGLRGGNMMGALAQFRPSMLKGLIDDQYSRLGGLSSLGAQIKQNLVSMGSQGTQNLVTMGQNSAAGTGAAGMQTGANIAALFGEQGAARAGASIAKGNAWGDVLALPAQFMGLKMGMGGTGGLF